MPDVGAVYLERGKPARIQRQRTKGWRMPEGAVYVGRPSRFGNPFVVRALTYDWEVYDPSGRYGETHLFTTEGRARQAAVDLYRLHTGPFGLYEFDDNDLVHLRSELRGRDLVCWCPADMACHADVLIELAAVTP